MSRINYPATSPYAITPQTAGGIGRYVHRTIPAHSQDAVYTIEAKYNLRPDLLAYDLYGSEDYWWVFCVRNMNHLRDPIWDFKTGVTIVLPPKTHIQSVIA